MIDSIGSHGIDEDGADRLSSNRKDFSFNKTDTRKSSGRSILKLEEIRHQLSHLDTEKLCQMLIQEISHNEQLRAELLQFEGRYEACREDVRLLSQSLAFKRESFLMLSESQTKNEQQIIKLEQELNSFKGRYNLQSWTSKVDSDWHKKYNQLARHMDVYVENIKEVQEAFTRQQHTTQKQLQSLYDYNTELNGKIRQMVISNTVQAEQLKSLKLQMMEAQKTNQTYQNELQKWQTDQERISRLEQMLVENDERKLILEQKCQKMTVEVRVATSLVEELRAKLIQSESVSIKDKEALEADRLTMHQQLHLAKSYQEQLQMELETLRVHQSSQSETVFTQIRQENLALRTQLDQAYKTIGSLKAEVILLKGEADRAKGHMRKQAERNIEIRQQLDRFCRRKRETTSPDDVLYQLQNTANSIGRKQSVSSHAKIHEFILDEPTTKFSPGKENRTSCIIGEETSH